LESPQASREECPAGKGAGPLADVLGFFAAARVYGYLDVVGNAIDEVTVLQALEDALRDFKATCIDRRPDPREVGAYCPRVSYRQLEEAVEAARRAASIGGGCLVRFTRHLALQALARSYALRLRGEESPEEAGGSRG
jgi:hypothetical protein